MPISTQHPRRIISVLALALLLFGVRMFSLGDAADPLEQELLDALEDEFAELLPKESSQTSSSSTYLVTRVIDGDTIELEGGEKVRYIGINTPETKHPTKGKECFGEEASQQNKQLVEGKQVRLEQDVQERDRYGRLLAYVYLDESDLFVNEYLVQSGYAYESPYPPNIAYQEQFEEAELRAREELRGLWDACIL
jgi:micrococcal nuclease